MGPVIFLGGTRVDSRWVRLDMHFILIQSDIVATMLLCDRILLRLHEMDAKIDRALELLKKEDPHAS